MAELTAMLLARGSSSVPAPQSVILESDGTLRLLDEGPHDLAPVPRLAGVLDGLLPSVACPPELRQLVADGMADPPAQATVSAFADALAFFERPGRHELLQAVAARVSEADVQARVNVELEQLQARTRNLSDKADSRARTMRRRVRWPVLLFAAIVLLGVLAGVILALFASNATRATITERVRARVEQIAQTGLEVIGVRTRRAPASAPAVTSSPRVPRKISPRAPHQLPVTISVQELQATSIPAVPSIAIPEMHDLIAPDETIYTDEEEGVEPAVLIRPQLPTRPQSTVSPEEVGVLEVVVSATGAVEHVRLISTANRYHDRMLVAAAKAWPFKPATKDGRPVRYRTRVRVTL